jgi:transcriptional regulator GlxA family with amidase domain
MLHYFYSEKKPPEDLLELKFRELLLNIITNPANAEMNAYLQTLLLPESDNLQPVMEANSCYNLGLEVYAKLCNRSLSSFKRDFHKVYGTPPGHWLINKRLGYAHQLLISTSKSIQDISHESGFENNTHFSKVFKKKYGIPPLQYRLKTTVTPSILKPV